MTEREWTIKEFFDKLVEELDRQAEEKERERTHN